MGTLPLAAPWLLPLVLSQLQPEPPPVITLPPPPPPAFVWLTGQASLVGGLYTSSEVQHNYAQLKQLSFLQTEADYYNRIQSGNLVLLQGPYIYSIARRPYVLPSTYRFVERLSVEYSTAGCGRLTITSASRLVSERPRNGSVFSVHPAGMAVDVRVNGISIDCETWLNAYLLEKEMIGEVDATREYRPPHYHLVVPVEPIVPTMHMAQVSTSQSDQSN